MTGICAVNLGRAAVVWTDTLTCGDEKGAESRASKILAVPHIPMVFASAGSAAEHATWFGYVNSSEDGIEDFDDFVRLVHGVRERLLKDSRGILQGCDGIEPQIVVHAGWSNERRRTGLVVVIDRSNESPIVGFGKGVLTVPPASGRGSKTLMKALRTAPMTESMRRLARIWRKERLEISDDIVAAVVSRNRTVLLHGDDCEMSPLEAVERFIGSDGARNHLPSSSRRPATSID